ncbi:MAG: helix-turn-helix domain-containing protein [Bacteroidales bacterium]|nr:helix-turn-helix domain-containing protein [Bacteroidales bacterium]MDD4671183.1 helix-turn-helix domain-containing protein [Bacteroidales bacterium]
MKHNYFKKRVLSLILGKVKKRKAVVKRGVSHEVLFKRMEMVMTQKQLFLNNSLTINKFAREVGTNRTYITRILSSKGFNFKTYINSFRIQYAIELLSKKRDERPYVPDIAEQSGFASARSMNYYMVKTIGVTAYTFIKRQK